jgi:DNA-binding winged helix-turn-helix (wHTH) protein
MGDSYQFGDCRITPARRELWRAGKLVALPPQVFDFLSYLIEHHDRAVGRDELVAAVWGKTEVSDTLLGQTVLRLRRELGDDAKEQRLLRTIPRFGYRWVAPLERVDPVAATPAEAASNAIAPSVEAAPRTRAKRGPLVAIGLIVLLGIAAAVFFYRYRTGTVASPAHTAQLTAVLPADVEPSAEWSWMRLGVMDLVATRLRTAGVPNVPSENVVAYLHTAGARGTDGLRDVTSAQLLVTPRVRRVGSEWSISLDADDGAGRHYAVDAQAGEFAAATRAASDKLLGALGARTLAADGEAPYADLLQQIDAAVLADNPDRARQLLEQASAEQKQAPELRLRLAKIDFRAGKFAQARERLLRLLDEAPAATAPLLRAGILNGLGAVAVRQDNAPLAETYFAEAITLLSAHADARQLGEAYLGHAAAAADQHHFDAAIAGYAQARIALRQANDALALVRVSADEGFLDLDADRPAQAVTQLHAAAASFLQWGALNEAILSDVGEIDAHLALLDAPAALHVADAAAELAQRIDNPDTLESLTLARARALAALGRLREARAALVDLRNTTHDSTAAAAAGGILATLELEQHNDVAARELAAQAVAALTAPNHAAWRAQAWLTAVRVALNAGDASAAQTSVAELESWAQHSGEPRAVVLAALARAEHSQRSAASGDWRADFEAARALTERSGVPLEISAVALSYGGALLAAGDLKRAEIEVGRVSRWAEQDFPCAVLTARLFAALGRDEARQALVGTARSLAGERNLPPDALAATIK